MYISHLLAQSQSQCELNGQPIDCSELANKAKPFIGIGLGIFGFIIVVTIVSFIFWVVMLIHALNHKSPDRTAWIVALVASFFLGFGLIAAIIYFFAEKKKAELAVPDQTIPQAVATPQYPPDLPQQTPPEEFTSNSTQQAPKSEHIDHSKMH